MSLIHIAKKKLRPAYNRMLTDELLRRLKTHQAGHPRSAILIATPIHGNLGDQAIVLAQREFFADRFPELAVFEISRFQYELAREEIAELVRPCDLVVIDGGGNVGTLWPEENDKMNDIVRRFARTPVAVFPQTAYFSDDEEGRACERATADAYAANPRLVFFSRDKATYEKIGAMAPAATNLFVPDIVLYHDASGESERSGALLCLRNDKECAVGAGAADCLRAELAARGLAVRETDTVVFRPRRINESNRDEVLRGKWAEFGSAEVVVTDRLHGMIFSAITGTPCVALDNVSHKVSQGNEWISHIDNIKVARSLDEVPALLGEVLSAGPRAYDRAPLAPYHEVMGEAISRAID